MNRNKIRKRKRKRRERKERKEREEREKEEWEARSLGVHKSQQKHTTPLTPSSPPQHQHLHPSQQRGSSENGSRAIERAPISV